MNDVNAAYELYICISLIFTVNRFSEFLDNCSFCFLNNLWANISVHRRCESKNKQFFGALSTT